MLDIVIGWGWLELGFILGMIVSTVCFLARPR
jgi:hypothetical protein